MNFDEISFHDAKLLSVIENPADQRIDFLIDYFTDWYNHISEHRTLRFNNVTYYCIDEIAFQGSPTILDIKYKQPQLDDAFGNQSTTIIIDTNAGSREIQFKEAVFV